MKHYEHSMEDAVFMVMLEFGELRTIWVSFSSSKLFIPLWRSFTGLAAVHLITICDKEFEMIELRPDGANGSHDDVDLIPARPALYSLL